ncbi:coenzyme F420-0:L-glutamate ligase [Actinopolymorpha sp. B11F2]|uniref:coenzyme F420-0:L-glutamate ligase n=1 Tax=Actinopolymorpha sp. B11F2 TaxID=3160862 RepID=UPI0032E3D948
MSSGAGAHQGEVVIRPVLGMPEVEAGADLAGLIAAHTVDLRDHDIVVVSSKIVSKAEDRTIAAADGAAVDPLQVAAMRADAIRAETVRVVAERGAMRIVETRHGFVMAAAGVDASNVAAGSVLLLPVDPDGSARALRTALSERLGVTVGVLITDTFGRPWRLGQTDLAIGAAGVRVIDSHRGRHDAHGNELAVTAPAHGDELAGAAELVKGKIAQVPVAIIRGLAALVTEEDGPGVRALVRTAEEDMFRLGTREAGREAVRSRPRDGLDDGLAVGIADRLADGRPARLTDGLTDGLTGGLADALPDRLADAPVDVDAVRQAVAVLRVPTGRGASRTRAWGLAEVDDAEVRKPLLDAVGLPTSVAYVAVVYVRTHESAGRTAALLALGGIRERLALACAVEGVGSAWIPAERFGSSLVRSILPADVETVGMLAIGAALP